MQYHYFWMILSTKNNTTNAFNWRDFAGGSDMYLALIRLWLCVVIRESTRHMSSLRNFGWFVGCQTITSSPDSQPAWVSVCVPTNPAVDPSPTATPTSRSPLFDDFQKKNNFEFCKYRSVWCQNFIWFKCSDTTTAYKFSRFQETQLLGNSSSVRSTEKIEDKKTL